MSVLMLQINSQENNMTIKEERFSCDFDHMYTSTSVHNNGEMRHIKEMSLLHLDVIQHQSEELVRKDKIIAALKKENEMVIKVPLKKYVENFVVI
jgi:DNA-binding winged helix-turn-helix (wHTH) protein